jgi:hypothetical protein
MSEFVTYKQALALKGLGYDVPAYGKYIKNRFNTNTLGGGINFNSGFYGVNIISAPQYSQAFEWLRTKHNLFIYPDRLIDNNGAWYFFVAKGQRTNVAEGDYSYDVAMSLALDTFIEIIKEK